MWPFRRERERDRERQNMEGERMKVRDTEVREIWSGIGNRRDGVNGLGMKETCFKSMK